MRSEDGLIMSIRKFNANCLNALIEIYNDGTYKLYDTNIIPDSEVINAILIWDDPKTFTFKYNALDILKDMKKINKGEYEIQLGSGEVYTTDSSNKALMAFLNNEDIDLNKCGKTIKREIENGLYKLANNIYSSEINPKFVHEGEVISVANFLSSSYCTYECIFNHEKPIEVKNNIRIYSYDVLESKYYLVECGNIYIGKDKNALINYCQKS